MQNTENTQNIAKKQVSNIGGRIDTAEVHQRDRLPFWRDAITQSFVELECDALGNPQNFHGKVTNRLLSEGQLSKVTSSGQHVERSQKCIKHSDSDVYLLSLQMTGTGIIAQHGRKAVLSPGDFALYDTVRPYTLHFDHNFSQIVMRIPRALGKNYLPGIEWLTAQRIKGDQGYGRVVSNHLAEIYASSPDQAGIQDETVLRSFLHLLSAVYNAQDNQGSSFTSTVKMGQLARIKNFIQDHLTNSDLNPQMIADAHGISARYLNMLFKEEDSSPGRWIWSTRLDKCRDIMQNPQHIGLSLSEIAYANGFNDMAHFSRAFKKRFGQSPRAYRQQSIH